MWKLDPKKKRIICGAVAVILVLAMVVTTVLSALIG